MRNWMQKTVAVLAALALAMPSLQPGYAQRPDAPQSGQAGSDQSGFVLKANAELVLTNVVVRDAKTGEVVRGLRQSDFRF